MEINMARMESLISLYKDNPALKGLDDDERKALTIMKRALKQGKQSVDIQEGTIDSLESKVKRTLSRSPSSPAESFLKGVANRAGLRTGSASVQKELQDFEETDRAKAPDIFVEHAKFLQALPLGRGAAREKIKARISEVATKMKALETSSEANKDSKIRLQSHVWQDLIETYTASRDEKAWTDFLLSRHRWNAKAGLTG